MNDKKITGECCGRPMQYAAESKCNYNNCCMDEYCGRKLGRIKEMEPTCDSTAVIPSITVESVEGITNLANCLVHVNDINTTFYVDDKHRVMITWAGPVDIPGYDMKNNPNGYRDQIVTDVENETAVIYDKHGKGYLFGITPDNLQEAVNNKLDEMASDGTLENIIASYIEDVAHVFDTVADMKVSTELVNGSYARTLGFHTINDGGGALYKITDTGTANEMDIIAIGSTLRGHLVLPTDVTPEIFGAYCDGIHNDSPYIQKAIDTDHKVLLTKSYYTTNPIYLGNQDSTLTNGWKNNLVFEGDKSSITYTGDSSAVIIAGIQGGKISFGEITSSNGNCIEMWSTNGYVRLAYIDLSFNVLKPNKKGIYIHADVGSSGTGFINEIDIYGGTIRSGEYGIYTTETRETASTTLGMDSHRYHYVCFEGCDNCIYINAINGTMQGFVIDNIRYKENTSSGLLEIAGRMRHLVFDSWFAVYPDRLDFANATLLDCLINAPIRPDANSNTIASGMYIENNVINYLCMTSEDKTLTKSENIGGTIHLMAHDNQTIINFVNITTTTATTQLVSADNSPCKPLYTMYGTVTSTDGKVARVRIETTGEIRFNGASADIGTQFAGQLVFYTNDKKRNI